MNVSRGRRSVRTKSISSVLAVMLIFAMLPGSTAASAPPAPSALAVPDVGAPTVQASESVTRTDRVLVRWSTPLSVTTAAAAPRLTAMASATGRTPVFVRFNGSGAAVYDLGAPLGLDAKRILDGLGQAAGVASVEPDLWMTADVVPNDTRASELWGLLGAADGYPYGIDATGAWTTTTGAGVTVAVIDTGLAAHTDLVGQSVAGYDMIAEHVPDVANDGNGRDSNAADPGDWCGTDPSSWHGTHVAGTIAALAGNSLGVFGGAPGVKIQPVRVLGTCGGYASDVADGIRWAAGGTVPGVPANATPARVLNLSLSGFGSCLSVYASAIADARSRGAVVVVAAGNANMNSGGYAPANCPGVITVAAIGQAGTRASFSNYGSSVDLAGPGVGILSTIDSGATGPSGPTYAAYEGTSMATPHVALTAALVIAAHPSLTPDAVEFILKATVTAFASNGSATGCAARGCGAGIVNAGRAIAYDVTPPAVSAFASTNASPTSGTTIAYSLTFSESVSGLATSDFSNAGTSSGWTVSTVSGSGAGPYTVTLVATAPTAGTVLLSLGPSSVADVATNTGPTSAVTAASVTVVTTPSAPTGPGATAGNASAVVSWSAPASDGGSPITSYTATAAPGGATCAASGLSCTVNGLANGAPYTFSVTATNAVGNGPASDASAAVTPTVPPVPPVVVPVAPTAAIAAQPAWLASSAIPLAWGASPGTASVAGYDVRYRRAPWNGGFGAAVLWRSATLATGATFPGAAGSTYCFSVRARALALVSAWTAETCTAIPLDDRSLTRSGRWSALTGPAYYRSTYLRSFTSGARLVRTGVVARRLAIVATTCPTCGTVKVYLGATLLRTIRLTSATTVNRKLIPVATFTSARRGTLTIRISSSARRVVIDGVAIRRN